MTQLSLELSAVGIDFLEEHMLRVVVDTRTVDPDDRACISFMRRYLNESPRETRRVWVMATHPHSCRGQLRMYMLGDGVLRHTMPDYLGEWPELDEAVAAHLKATLYGPLTWGHNGPREEWRDRDCG